MRLINSTENSTFPNGEIWAPKYLDYHFFSVKAKVLQWFLFLAGAAKYKWLWYSSSHSKMQTGHGNNMQRGQHAKKKGQRNSFHILTEAELKTLIWLKKKNPTTSKL